MNEYKSSASRLARLFKRSRDNWKERAKAKQKKARALETKVRDLNRSRSQWKEKAKQAQHELAQLKEQLAKDEEKKAALEAKQERHPQQELTEHKEQSAAEKTGRNAKRFLHQKEEEGKVVCATGEEWHRAAGHHYPAEIVQLGIEQVTHSLNSLRGTQKTFALFNRYFKVGTPSYNSIRSWMLRVGLYELKQQPAYDEDWVLMLDATLELGTMKCLGILGLPLSRLGESGYALKHSDVDVLGVVPLTSCTGEVIAQQLKKVVKQQKRPPLQIVSDHGSDIKKGIGWYKQQHSKLIWTHDITHAMALLLKKELKEDETYQAFMGQCNLTRQRIKQTPLYFLSPPKQRTKARYLNIESHIRWAQQLLHYQDRADFSTINPNYQLDKTALTLLQTQLDPDTLTKLTSLKDKTYPERQSFCHHLSHYLGADRWLEYEKALCHAADLGRRYFEEKLGWVSAYRSALPTYAHLSHLVNTIAQQLKQQGLSHASVALFNKKTASLILSPRLQRFKNFILSYLRNHIAPLSPDQTLLASSDVLESIFGKYKLFSSERSFKEIGQMILTIPLFTAKLTPQRIKLALETISTSDLQCWTKQTFGQSMLSKRRNLLNFTPTQIGREKPT